MSLPKASGNFLFGSVVFDYSEMKILLCNKVYHRAGGASIYTINLAEMLRERGHEVAVFAMKDPQTLKTPWSKYFPSGVNMGSPLSKLRFAARCMGDRETSARFKALLDAFRPDVVHLNNIHSQLSPIIAKIAHTHGCRVVWTLHDYKLLCPRYDCLRNGKEHCEACFSDKKNVLRYSCMKNSLSASVVAYCEALKWNRERLEAWTDAFLCPSSYLRDKMLQGGFRPGKLHHRCNFIDTTTCKRTDYDKRGDYYCYVGRLSHEKGLETLVKAAASLPYRLLIVGDGPLNGKLPVADNIEYTGRKEWPQIKEIVGAARFLVIPSEWGENNPLSVIESLCLGTPVLGARIGGIPELIKEGVTGATFTSGDKENLASAIPAMYAKSFDYASIAADAQARFSADSYYLCLMELYQGK